MNEYCLDTFALIAYLKNERGSDKIEELLKSASKKKAPLLMHKINLGELYYTIFKREGEIQADFIYGRIKEFPIDFVEDLSEGFLLSAAKLKGSYKMSYADAFAAALAIQKETTLVTGDSDFQPLEKEKKLSILWL